MEKKDEPLKKEDQGQAQNTCAFCSRQKRRCDKKLPKCGRCTRMGIECDYKLYLVAKRWTNGPAWSFNVPPDTQAPYPSAPFTTQLPPSYPGDGLTTYAPWNANVMILYIPGTDTNNGLDHLLTTQVFSLLEENGVELADVMSFYRRTMHPWLPIIDFTRFESRLMKLHTVPSAEVAMLLLAVHLACQKPAPDEMSARLQSSLYNTAKQFINFLSFGRTPTLELVQAGLMIALYELGSSQTDAAYLTVGLCARLGFMLGLHQSAVPNYGLSLSLCLDAARKLRLLEERKRAWCGIYIFDRLTHQLQGDLTRPFAVDDPAPDSELPSDDETFNMPIDVALGDTTPGLNYSSPLALRTGYLARQAQATYLFSRVLRHIKSQELSSTAVPLSPSTVVQMEFREIDALLRELVACIFSQAAGTWDAYCSAISILMLAMLTLHRTRFSSLATHSDPNSPPGAIPTIPSKTSIPPNTPSPSNSDSTPPPSNPPPADLTSMLALQHVVTMSADILDDYNVSSRLIPPWKVPMTAGVAIEQILRMSVQLQQVGWRPDENERSIRIMQESLMHCGKRWARDDQSFHEFVLARQTAVLG